MEEYEYGFVSREPSPRKGRLVIVPMLLIGLVLLGAIGAVYVLVT